MCWLAATSVSVTTILDAPEGEVETARDPLLLLLYHRCWRSSHNDLEACRALDDQLDALGALFDELDARGAFLDELDTLRALIDEINGPRALFAEIDALWAFLNELCARYLFEFSAAKLELDGNSLSRDPAPPKTVPPYHFERPDATDPHFELSVDAFDIQELNTFPPAAAGGLAPEEKKLLGHADGVVIRNVVALDVGAEASECDGSDDRFVWLRGTVAPAVVVIETARYPLAYC